MIPLLAHPLALIGLAALPTLVAIYALRNRYQRRTVSSIMFWPDARRPREGGRRIQRLSLPLLFLLELLALILLALAASDPRVEATRASRGLVVVLDDSYSMLAGEPESSRARAAQFVIDQVGKRTDDTVRLIAAGAGPRLLGEASRGRAETGRRLDEWHCRSARADLGQAITLAKELAGPSGRVLVVTDHAPDDLSDDARLVWRAFGGKTQNMAIVNAARTAATGDDRLMLEIVNLATEAQSTTLRIAAEERDRPLRNERITLQPMQMQRLVLSLPDDTPTITASISNDALRIDDRVVLLPDRRPSVRVRLQIRNLWLRDRVHRALQTMPHVKLTGAGSVELFVTDGAPPPLAVSRWVVRIDPSEDADAYVGPFVIDHAHPLAEGLGLNGVVWAAGRDPQAPGRVVVAAGNIPLLTDVARPGGQHELLLRLQAGASTLTESPNWPIFWWNLLDWRAAAKPGVEQPNVRLGSMVTVRTPRDVRQVTITPPAGAPRQLKIHDPVLMLAADQVGLTEVRSDPHAYRFAANALDRNESDLTKVQSGEWGRWIDAATLHRDYRSVAWALLLAVIGTLTLHSALVARQPRGIAT